ncbi:MAG: hypothetical protein IJX62_07705 [Clostridia bacterium]|nr:hypothetical protein [Clostridia bacterium]
MDFIKKEILSGELVPILLGISPESVETARRMYRQYGVISHVFCEKLPLPMRLSLCMKFHVIPAIANGQLMVQALTDFALQFQHADVILYLIPCTAHYANLIWHHHAALEGHFVLADRREMRTVWFGDQNELSKGDLQ